MLFRNLFGDARAHNLSGSSDKSIKLHNIRFGRLQYFTTRFRIYVYLYNIFIIKETNKRRAKIVFVYPYVRRIY